MGGKRARGVEGARSSRGGAADVLGRRLRLAFLDTTAAKAALPRVVERMAEVLGWDEAQCAVELGAGAEYLRGMGGPEVIEEAAAEGGRLVRTRQDVEDKFRQIDADGSGALDAEEIGALARSLGQPLGEEEVQQLLGEMDEDGNGTVDLDEFTTWWNSEHKSRVGARFSEAVAAGSSARESYP